MVSNGTQQQCAHGRRDSLLPRARSKALQRVRDVGDRGHGRSRSEVRRPARDWRLSQGPGQSWQSGQERWSMGDGHLGYAVPIGSVVAYRDAISPSGVGFEIACGNKAVRLDMPVEDLRVKIGTPSWT